MTIEDLPASWTRDCDAAVMTTARAAYESPGRHYHTWSHIKDCLDKLRDFPCGDPRSAFLALLFHDAVYVTGEKENEQRSADLARETLRNHSRLSTEAIDEIERFILATRSHAVDPAERSSDLRAVVAGAAGTRDRLDCPP